MLTMVVLKKSLLMETQSAETWEQQGVGKLKEKEWPKGPLAIGYGSLSWCNVGLR